MPIRSIGRSRAYSLEVSTTACSKHADDSDAGFRSRASRTSVHDASGSAACVADARDALFRVCDSGGDGWFARSADREPNPSS